MYKCRGSKTWCNYANIHKVDLFVSIHLNAGGGKGVEVLYSPGSVKGKEYATRVSNSMCKLGFVNRGAKSDVRGLYELKYTTMPAIIVETLFCDSAIDVILYQKLGADILGKAIAEGIVGHAITVVKPVVKPAVVAPVVSAKTYRVVTGSFTDKDNAAARVAELKKLGVESFIVEK